MGGHTTYLTLDHQYQHQHQYPFQYQYRYRFNKCKQVQVQPPCLDLDGDLHVPHDIDRHQTVVNVASSVAPGTLQSTKRAREGTTQHNLPKGARIKPMGPIDLTPPGVPAPYSRQDRVAAGGCFWIMTKQTDFMLSSLARVIEPQKQPSGGIEKKDRKPVRSS
ncbi:hypothetical protein CGLO_00625 [Colletotrichum gloeosporioides Cg-14]|uniref:Uncharacterized protein n=1 Tax=Colletotrichum gloeosporioides (strain Cg-14) TaxID=1237896 RepID=T0MDJ5_COLGC|nr:hypothetical protein CGLO_00625 [Colletotrichum gloeosporioides Cg-14]